MAPFQTKMTKQVPPLSSRASPTIWCPGGHVATVLSANIHVQTPLLLSESHPPSSEYVLFIAAARP